MSIIPSRKTIHNTALRSAPSAIRIPISWRRWFTKNPMTNQKRLNERWILIQREVNAVFNLRIQLFPRIARHSDDPQPGASPGGWSARA